MGVAVVGGVVRRLRRRSELLLLLLLLLLPPLLVSLPLPRSGALPPLLSAVPPCKTISIETGTLQKNEVETLIEGLEKRRRECVARKEREKVGTKESHSPFFCSSSPPPPSTSIVMPSLHLSEHRDGDEKKTKENKPDRPLKPSLEPLLLPTAASKGITSARDGESRFARALASGDASTRLRALDALVAWLFAKGNCSAAANSVTRDDMRKLWKGMFYSYWHSDLALVQVRSLVFSANLLAAAQTARRRCRT